MADFCAQCTLDMFGWSDRNDLSGITTEKDEAKGEYALVICEGCGCIQVDSKGNCVSDCLLHHAKEQPDAHRL